METQAELGARQDTAGGEGVKKLRRGEDALFRVAHGAAGHEVRGIVRGAAADGRSDVVERPIGGQPAAAIEAAAALARQDASAEVFAFVVVTARPGAKVTLGVAHPFDWLPSTDGNMRVAT